ncbi:hypothetical protein ACQW02_13865 [Humitalea sp. 24SJ18S-53]|uniref:hypothetical protein n=1 Tax=Humitalea sp. 24SJ18S-53 TaxID=3422307 RepID=UPI003D677A3A
MTPYPIPGPDLARRLRSLAVLAALGLGAACAPLPAPGSAGAPPLSQARQVQDDCRADADRILARRDRGEFIRREEQESRLGAGAYAGPVTDIDRLAVTWQRDQMAAACVRGRNEANEVSPGTAPVGATPAAATPAGAAPAGRPNTTRALPPPGVTARPGG